MQERLDYQLNNNNKPKGNYSEEYITKENKKLREEVYAKDEKIDVLFNFLINMQQSIINKTTSLTVLQNLDLSSLRDKINNIQEGVHELIYRNQNLNFNQRNNESGNNFNANSTMKSTYCMRNLREYTEENEQIR